MNSHAPKSPIERHANWLRASATVFQLFATLVALLGTTAVVLGAVGLARSNSVPGGPTRTSSAVAVLVVGLVLVALYAATFNLVARMAHIAVAVEENTRHAERNTRATAYWAHRTAVAVERAEVGIPLAALDRTEPFAANGHR